jgi:aldehyde dehydrogenase (NAD+)
MQNYINGRWVSSETGRTHENRNPADPDELVCTFPDSSVKDVDAAVAAAKKAYRSWRLLPAPRRAEYLFKIGAILSEKKEQYARDMTREMGKVLAETRGDVQEGIDTAYLAAGEGRRLFGDSVPCELPNKAGWSERHPIGVCGLITPWNFPMAIPTWKLFPALVCGNTAVIKPASDTPLSVYNLVKACEEAGLPEGVVNLVTGDGRNVGNRIVEHPDVRVISFTGSSTLGAGWASSADARSSGFAGGRQERHHRHGRRRPRPGPRRRAVGRVRHHRAALHGDQPFDPAQADQEEVRQKCSPSA